MLLCAAATAAVFFNAHQQAQLCKVQKLYCWIFWINRASEGTSDLKELYKSATILSFTV
jgi:hypothetical protein